jgi:hypothetical protein
MEASDIILLFMGSLIAMLGIITARALTEKKMEFIRIQTEDQILREKNRKKHIDSLYGRGKND